MVNLEMQSFLFKMVCCILINNVTFGSSCYEHVCKASCYGSRGTDSGHCVNGVCQCLTPTIYVFDGIGRDLNENLIKRSLGNNNLIQNAISTPKNYVHRSREYKSNTLQEKNKIWKKIWLKIAKQYPSMKERDLEKLKAALFTNGKTLDDFYNRLLNNPLVTVLNEMKNNRTADVPEECENLLKRLQKPRGVNNNSPGNINPKHPLPNEKKSGPDDKVPKLKVLLEESKDDEDDRNSGEELDVPKKPKQNHPQVAKDGIEPSGSDSEYEYEDDDNDEPVNNN